MFRNSQAFSSFSVDDLSRAKMFYADVLGLMVRENECGLEMYFDHHAVFIYPKPDHAAATFTVLNFPVDDIDQAVAELRSRGIQLECYDQPGMQTDARGIREDNGMKIAWFRDPAGNVLSVLEATRRY